MSELTDEQRLKDIRDSLTGIFDDARAFDVDFLFAALDARDARIKELEARIKELEADVDAIHAAVSELHGEMTKLGITFGVLPSATPSPAESAESLAYEREFARHEPKKPKRWWCVECGPETRFDNASAMHFDAYGHTPTCVPAATP